jgi:hypothetical protein
VNHLRRIHSLSRFGLVERPIPQIGSLSNECLPNDSIHPILRRSAESLMDDLGGQKIDRG